MPAKHKTIFVTARSAFHQQRALNAAPEQLDVKILRNPDRNVLKEYLRDAVYWISERAGVIDAELIGLAPDSATW